MSRGGKCRCRNRRGGKKMSYRSPDEAATAAERLELVDVEPYKCPRGTGRWHLRTTAARRAQLDAPPHAAHLAAQRPPAPTEES